MSKTLKVSLVVALMAFLWGTYVAPQRETIVFTSQIAKRFNSGDDSGRKAKSISETNDVVVINAITPDGDAVVFINEAEYFYGKFNSSNMDTEISGIMHKQNQSGKDILVTVWKTGWRMDLPYRQMYENLISLKVVETPFKGPDPVHWALVSIITLMGFILSFMIGRRVRQVISDVSNKVSGGSSGNGGDVSPPAAKVGE